jgi:hypothetical protein
MNAHSRAARPRRRAAVAVGLARRPHLALLAAWTLALLLLALAAPRVRAGEHPPFAARAGLALATEAAVAWSPDAALVYVENDEEVDAGGAAKRWGYLFRSPSLGRSRAYSVRGGKIVTAENLEMRFEAPPLAGEWLDSGAALAAAARALARDLERLPGARLRTMLLVRGPFQDGAPDATTWTLVWAAPGAPALFAMVDAADGKVRRTWRG